MKFDIIIPTVNRASLDTTIASVYAQRHTDWHLYIIGDGVVPDVKDYDKDKVTVIGMDDPTQDSGASQRNLGIRMGDSDWIAYLDDDDIWYPDHLSTIVELARQNPKANIFKTAAQEMVLSRKSPRHKKEKMKLRCVNTDDPLTITLAHSRDLFYRTSTWQPQDNHDHILFKEMLKADGVLAKTDNITTLFLR